MKWLALTIFGVLLTILQVLFSWFLAFWPVRLPRWLGWFQTQDNDLMGDGGHWQRWAWLYRYVPRWLAGYVQRIAWLIRNPTDGWDYTFEVVVTDPKSVTWSGDPQTSNRPGHSGWCRARTESGEWMLYIVYRWPGTNRCLRIYLGWKLMGAVHGAPGRYPLVCVPNPLSSYEVGGNLG